MIFILSAVFSDKNSKKKDLPKPDINSEEAYQLLDTLLEQLGKPYVYGAEGPDGFDCSGLVKYAYAGIGLVLPRVVADQAKMGIEIDKSSLRFGDLVFFSKDGTALNHVGIYIGNGYMVHAPETGDVVKITRISAGNYGRTYKKAVRVLN